MNDIHNLVIVPFGCIPLNGVFRKNKCYFRRGDLLSLSDFGKRLSFPFTYIEFEEEALVITSKKEIADNLHKYIVEEIENSKAFSFIYTPLLWKNIENKS